jgi:hypothetical protein
MWNARNTHGPVCSTTQPGQLHRRERFLAFLPFFFDFFFAFFAIANLLKEVCSFSCTGAAVRATTPRRVQLLAVLSEVRGALLEQSRSFCKRRA